MNENKENAEFNTSTKRGYSVNNNNNTPPKKNTTTTQLKLYIYQLQFIQYVTFWKYGF